MISKYIKKQRIKFLEKTERWASKNLGKGWGTETILEEISQIQELVPHLHPSLCIDIGGNKGLYTEALLNRFPTAKIYTFEPAAANLLVLKDRFSGDARVEVIAKGVARDDAMLKLYSDTPGSGLASLTKRQLDHFKISFEHEEIIEVINFERFWVDTLNNAPIDICKLDIEGHELDALRGMGAALDVTKVVQFEFGGCNIDTRTFFQDFWYFFAERNFSIYRITPYGPVRVKKYSEKDEFFSTTNFIAVNKW
jgi:FkbM family methyltransferase